MTRILKASLASLALGLLFCASATAAPVLSFDEAKQTPEVVNRGDEIVGYLIDLKNTGTTPTSGSEPTTVSISLPSGLQLAYATGSGWSCDLVAEICTSSAEVLEGEEFPQLRVQAWIFPGAASMFTASFGAVGGGAANEAITQVSVTLGPERLFEVLDFSAKAEDNVGDDYTVAGGHPYSATTTFGIPTKVSALGQGSFEEGHAVPVENLRDAYIELPAGFVGNPEAVPGICSVAQVSLSSCPASAGVGGIRVVFTGSISTSTVIYRVIPERGYPAAFAFRPVPLSPLTVVLRAKLRSNGDYGVTAVSPLPPQAPPAIGVDFATLCSHGVKSPGPNEFFGCRSPEEPGANEVPLLTNQTRCAGPVPVTRAHLDSFQNPGRQEGEGLPDLTDPNWKSAEAASPAGTDCEALTEAWTGNGPNPTRPSLTLQPGNSQAAAPTGYEARLHIPQEGLLDPTGRATSHLKNTVVKLPRGIALNPAAASGLGACTEAEAGLIGTGFPAPNPIRFQGAAQCPDSSKIGTAVVRTPILDKLLEGSVFLAEQDANPLKTRFAIYLAIDDPEVGVHVTLAGKVEPSETEEGRITTTFANNPQVPIEEVEIDFFGGPRAALANPDLCGDYGTRSELTPWSAVDPDNPRPDETAVSLDTVTIDTPPVGRSACPRVKGARPFNPGFDAGVGNPTAGGDSPFTLRITRADGDQEFDKLTMTTPAGLAATLRGVAICSDAAIAAAEAPGRTGKQEIAGPSCPASSRVGTTTIGAGVGPTPLFVKTGKVYLTGPYKGAPASLAFVVPAVAGPFDLGVQVVRTALRINPKTAQVTAESDSIPTILKGIPLMVREIRVDLDPGFVRNPTSCEPMGIVGQATGASGAAAALNEHFQVGDCSALGFKPDVKLQFHGKTRRAAYQRMVATVTARPGDANISRAAVTLPRSTFLAQEHIITVCTRVQFAANACPKGSIYGHAEATSPLLGYPISGPVYLRSSDNELPDLVADLQGPAYQPIRVELAGRTDSKNRGIRNTFDLVPDAPVTKFTLRLFGGKKSLVVNSENICRKKQKATVRLSAQNGKRRDFRPIVKNDCGKKKSKRGGKKR
ncbi:MAG TPA: hypothetical protein VEW07_03420 [Solirubrobacterales bacterium]|nr:hypothetical protein [Solirubrobacterales bacterium]